MSKRCASGSPSVQQPLTNQHRLLSFRLGSRAAFHGYWRARPGPSVRKPLLLVTDLDDTLVGGAHSGSARDEDTALLRDVLEAGRREGRVPVRIAINTGRTLPLFEKAALQKAHCLPRPDALIAGVGTRIYFPSPLAPLGGGSGGGRDGDASGDGGCGGSCTGWVEDLEWTATISREWSHGAVAALVDKAVAAFGSDCIFWQHPVEQNEHKATFLYHCRIKQELDDMLGAGLEEAGVKATIIGGVAAHGPGWRFSDILPVRAGKGTAMKWVRVRLGFQRHHTVACGDGANDLLMLQQACAAICVGNSQPEVKAWARERRLAAAASGGASDGGGGGGAGCSQGQAVHLASPVAHAAAGVLEGLAALGYIE